MRFLDSFSFICYNLTKLLPIILMYFVGWAKEVMRFER